MPGTADSPVIEPATALMAEGSRPGGPDEAWVKRGDAMMQKARETLDTRYYDRAEAAFRKALGLNPKNASAMTSMAWVCGGRHEFEASSEWAKKALALDPKQHAAYGLLGDSAVERGDYEAAFEHLQKMLAIRPDVSSYSRAARLMYLTGDTRKATWLMRRAISAGAPHAENTAWCRAQLALMLWHTGALLPAEQALEGALKQTPANFHLLAAMGQVKASRREYRAAIQYYEKAVAIAPQHEALVALGDLYALTGRKGDAEKQFARVERLLHTHGPSGAHGGIELARFYADHDRHLREALAMAEADYKAHPDVFGADTLAWCYFKNRRYQDAQKAVQKALRLGTPDARILFHAGMIAAKRGDRAGAQKYLYQALSLNPYFHPVDAATAADTLNGLGNRALKN
jgi:tetratricopeptide (TPR) repeat protein